MSHLSSALLAAEDAKKADVNGGEAFIWFVFLFFVLICVANGAEAADDRNGMALLWWGLMFLVSLGVLIAYSWALVSTS